MQSRQNGYGDDGPGLLDGSSSRRILAQTQVRAGVIVIERIRCQHPLQMPFAKDQNMIQAVAPERPDQALNIGGSARVTSVRSASPISPLSGVDV